MASVIKRIRGEVCECFEYDDPFYGDSGKMRLQLSGTFGGGIDRETMMLVPLFFSESELTEIVDLWLTEQERELDLPVGQSCSSSSWWAGSSDASRDHEITDEYDYLIAAAIAEPKTQECLSKEIERLYNEKKEIERELKLEYETGENACASQLEVRIEDLEHLIAEQEALLMNSELFTVGRSVFYSGCVYTVAGMEYNVVLLKEDSHKPCKKIHAAAYLKCAQLYAIEPAERKQSLAAQLKTASVVKHQLAEKAGEAYKENVWRR